MKKQKWIIVSNRLPLHFDATQNKILSSTGGLVTAVSGIKTSNEIVWLGSADKDLATQLTRQSKAGRNGANTSYKPIVLDDDLYEDYYNGYCNDTLWPILHYESELARHNSEKWAAYVEVNKRVARAIQETAGEGDLVWIHDFHFFLVPGMLQQTKKNFQVGFFLHVPFPSSEIFRQLPSRGEILTSLLSADLIGFHDYSYLRHFASSVYNTLGIETDMYSIAHNGHLARLGVFPVGIDTLSVAKKAKSAQVKKEQKAILQGNKAELLVLGVDRLDYIKGIDLKFRAFRRMLELNPEMQGKARLLQIAVPSRTDVEVYKSLRSRLEELVGTINGQFGSVSYTPIQYIFSSVPMDQLLALYRQANTLMVTSKRDGMNLVCQEFIACQDNADPGNLLLSEFTGAITNLSHAIPINPWNIGGTARALHSALSMSKKERQTRHRPMFSYLEKYTATTWAETFMVALTTTSNNQRENAQVQRIKPASFASKVKKHAKGRQVVLFVDYDGTLVGIESLPELAVLGSDSRRLLRRLAKKKSLQLVVTSGRPADFLEEQLGAVGIPIAGEHGALFYRNETQDWSSQVVTDTRWLRTALRIMEEFSQRVPGSFVEKKTHGACFHYRNSPREFGKYLAKRLRSELDLALANLPVTIIEGKKNVEVRAVEGNKGYFVRWYLSQLQDAETAVPVAIGDDQTDEDMFRVVQEKGGLALKVGEEQTSADFQFTEQAEVIEWLEGMDTTFK